MHRFEPRNANTKRSHLKSILTRQPGKKAEELEAVLMKVEGHMKQYDILSVAQSAKSFQRPC